MESHLPILSIHDEPWPPRSMIDDDMDIDLWPGLSLPSGSTPKDISDPFVFDQPDPHEKPFPFAFDTAADSMTTLHRGPNNGVMAISVSKTSEDDYQLYCRSGTPLSQGILYKDVVHKFGSILAMCELDLTLSRPIQCNANVV